MRNLRNLCEVKLIEKGVNGVCPFCGHTVRANGMISVFKKGTTKPVCQECVRMCEPGMAELVDEVNSTVIEMRYAIECYEGQEAKIREIMNPF